MVLLHGGSPKGAERIAARWADNRKVPQIAFKPDWTKHAKAAPFKRNDQMLDVLPIGVIVFPGIGHLGEPRRQGAETRNPGVEIRRGRRMSAAASQPSRRTTRTKTHFLDHALRPLYYEFVQSRAQTRREATTMFGLRMASIGAALVILTSAAIAEPLQRSGKARKTISAANCQPRFER